MSQKTDKNYQDYDSDNSNGHSGLDIRLLWGIFLRYKYWFIASVIVCLIGAFVYARYSTPVYEISTKVLVKEKENNYYRSSSIGAAFTDLGLMNNSNGFDNELEIIATKTMNKKVVKELKLYCSYFLDGRVKKRELYGPKSPFLVDIEESKLDSLEFPIMLEISKQDNLYNIVVKTQYLDSDEFDAKATLFEAEKAVSSFPAAMNTPHGKVTIEKNPLVQEGDMKKDFFAIVNPLDLVAVKYLNSMSVEATSKTTTIAAISIKDNVPDRSVDYLNKLVEVYNEDADLDNNIEANRTRDFIEERLAEISKDLNMTEAELEMYKRSSGIVDYANDAKLDVTQSVQYEQKLVELSTQISLVEYLNDYVNDIHNDLQVVPANIGLIDNNLNSVITKYNEAVLERNRLLRSASENSPTVAVITNQAQGYQSTLKASLQSAKRQLVMQRNSLQNQQNKYSNRISTAPSKERALADINRQQEVKAGLYLMLLQKREENLITLSSSAYKAKQIEEPIVAGPVSPKKKMILLSAFILGLILPYLYYFTRNFFRYRIENEQDLADLSDVPLFGTVPFVKALSKGTRTIVLKENHNSMMMEVYRALRSNLPFVLSPGQNVILFTSSTSGEGKTCVASNLGTSMAFTGKKVLLMGLDIRKPRLAGLFNLSDTDAGISNFLTRDAKDFEYLDNLIQKTDISDNLDVLPAGTIPPNPAELLERDNLANAVEYLKQKYDYIIMDTAPIGLVSDTLSIAKLADVVLYVVRANYTLKADISFLNSLNADGKLPNLNVVFNGVKQEATKDYSYRHYGSYGYGKGYGYGYGHGYGYGYGDAKLEEV